MNLFNVLKETEEESEPNKTKEHQDREIDAVAKKKRNNEKGNEERLADDEVYGVEYAGEECTKEETQTSRKVEKKVKHKSDSNTIILGKQ